MRFHSEDILTYRKNLEESIFVDKLISVLKTAWGKVKNTIKNIVDSIISKGMNSLQSLDDETVITIPYTIKDKVSSNLQEGGKESVKGLYNEILTVKYVIEKNKKPIKLILTEAKKTEVIVVKLDKKGEARIPEIENRIKELDKKLRISAQDSAEYKALFQAIHLASNEMANYIVNEVGNEDGYILEIYLDNMQAKEVGAENKADISMRVSRKFGEKLLKSYSLKMYKNPTVNLLNLTKISIITNLIGEKDGQQFAEELNNDAGLKALFRMQDPKEANRAVKNFKKNNPRYVVKGSKEEAEYLRLKRIRTVARRGPNAYLAEKVYNRLTKFINASPRNRDIVSQNILKLLGFNDSDTKTLIAFVGKEQMQQKRALIVDEHPELDLSNLHFRYTPGGTNIYVMGGKEPKKMLSFVFKEAGNISTPVPHQQVYNKAKQKQFTQKI